VAGSCKYGNESLSPRKNLGNSLAAERLASSQEGLNSMELVNW
jgi:hypothetical protein